MPLPLFLCKRGSNGDRAVTHPSIPTHSEAAKGVLDSIVEDFNSFVSTCGAPVYWARSDEIVQSSVSTILGKQFSINAASAEALETMPEKDMLASLIQKPSIDELYPRPKLEAPPSHNVADFQVKLAHNDALDKAASLVSVCHLPSFAVSGVTKTNRGAEAVVMPSDMGMWYLEVISLVQDLFAVAATLDMDLVQPVALKQLISNYDIYTGLVDVTNLFQHKLLTLDQMLESGDAVKLEKEGYVLPVPLFQLRAWRACMSIYSGRCIGCLMMEWVKDLELKVKDFRSANPEWRTVFARDGTIDMQSVAHSALGKMNLCAKHHNKLHILLGHIKKASECLDISPPVKTHPITRQAIILGNRAKDDAQVSYLSNIQPYGHPADL